MRRLTDIEAATLEAVCRGAKVPGDIIKAAGEPAGDVAIALNFLCGVRLVAMRFTRCGGAEYRPAEGTDYGTSPRLT